MIEVVSFVVVIVLSILSGFTFRKQYKKNALTKCLMMIVSMTMSIVIGIVIATWIPDMVLSTIIAILISAVLALCLTYKLPVYILFESFGALLMGGMMGAMLSLMTTNYAALSCVFFTVLYIVSTMVAIGFWNKEDYPLFKTAIPASIYGVATVAVLLLIGSSVGGINDADSNDTHHEEHQHNH